MYLLLPSDALTECAAFYRLLGLDLVAEQHGEGPVHYAASQPDLELLEVYPQRPTYRNQSVVLGFTVDTDLESVVRAAVTSGATVIDPVKNTSRGRLVRLADPQGRLVEVVESTAPLHFEAMGESGRTP